MGHKFYGPYPLLSGGDMSLASLQSQAMDMLTLPYGAFEVIWTGTPTGVLSVDGSLDGVNWYPTGTTVNSPSGSAGRTLINLQGVGFRFCRLSYAKSSGAGSLTVNGFSKGAM